MGKRREEGVDTRQTSFEYSFVRIDTLFGGEVIFGIQAMTAAGPSSRLSHTPALTSSSSHTVHPPHTAGAINRSNHGVCPRLLHHHGSGGVLLLYPAGLHPPRNLPLETVQDVSSTKPLCLV